MKKKDKFCLRCDSPLPTEASKITKYCCYECRHQMHLERMRKYYKKHSKELSEYQKKYRKKQRRKAWYRNPQNQHIRKEQTRHRRIFELYGLTKEAHQKLMEENKVCNICGNPETRVNKNGEKQPLCVDHDHQTGKVRGVLCQRCNLAIGHSKDNVAILQKMIDYLNKHNASE